MNAELAEAAAHRRERKQNHETIDAAVIAAGLR